MTKQNKEKKSETKMERSRGIDPKTMQELQILEQNLQNTLMQKQAFQMEVSETQSALKEIESADDEVFKIVGQMMIRSDKNKVLEDLKNKQKMLQLRMQSLEKQENSLSEKIEDLKKNLM